MNKKTYMKPAMQVKNIQQTHIICASEPGSHDEVSDKPSYARGGWGDDADWDDWDE